MTNNALYPWQYDSWEKLQKLRLSLPHAILFYGAKGIGKKYLIDIFIQSLLCENFDKNNYICEKCNSCIWFLKKNHPDFRYVHPEIFEQSLLDNDKKNKNLNNHSKEIKIDQIRELANFINTSSHYSKIRIVLLYPADTLNHNAANALLKMLEEPPLNSFFILLCNKIDNLLKTILSRCYKFILKSPNKNESLEWLKQKNISNPDILLSEQGGGPLIVFNNTKNKKYDLLLNKLKEFLIKSDIEYALNISEKLQKIPILIIFELIQRWIYDLFLLKITNINRYYPHYKNKLNQLAKKTDQYRLLYVLKKFNEKRLIINNSFSSNLLIKDILITYIELFY
ncbi:DNA polymerase III subunit delta' [Candidatus Profftella armatura (Diaphorina cf. continua)]|uniref:DNA polymerase III subunit delta n=1 Tax=Candidatus Profftella armatura (Diaphorina cf. continua) TaxID=2661583 RepID=A0A7R6VZ60_9PROT|nr:DNA polymerase III subunit delta' [Candidatus Profftella armatura (Diaphorina cf. continua)]BCG49731.1 DNA polymerase III subunit delta' [Candidatus Profftella armatura (Diaphorina cf. continua)]